MSDPTNTKTPPSPTAGSCRGAGCDPLTDAQRAEYATHMMNASNRQNIRLIDELDAAEAEIDAHREFHANDLTREHRDLIRSQALAMLSADTRIAAASSALATFSAIGAPYIARGVDNATDYIVKALRGAGKSIGRAMDDPDIRAGFVSSFLTAFSATSGIGLDDLIGSVPTPAPEAPKPAAPPPAPPKPAATPDDAKPSPASKKRAPKRKA